MGNYICLKKDRNAQNIIDVANKVVNLYLSGEKENSIIKSSELLKMICQYFFNQYPVNKELFLSKIVHSNLVKWAEFQACYHRIKNYLEGNKISDNGYEHNIMFFDWFLYEIGLIDKNNKNKELMNIRNDFFKNPKFNFSRSEENSQKDIKIKSFYRNAYRAEIYARQIFTLNMLNDGIKGKVKYTLNNGKEKVIDVIGMYDMYTPLILTRMAAEQCIKYIYSKKVDKNIPDSVSLCRAKLESLKIISRSFSNELCAVIKRGNANAHDSETSFNFGIMHGIGILKECEEFLKNFK